jgi:hypothetical protein
MDRRILVLLAAAALLVSAALLVWDNSFALKDGLALGLAGLAVYAAADLVPPRA